MKRAAAVLLCLTVACGGSSDPADESPTEVIGLITDIEPQEETEVPTSFTVEEEDGDTYTIDIDPEFNYGFDLLHVHEHFVTEDPVDVAVELRDGALVATSIEDVE
jgi:hypothetical protein